MCTFKIRKIKLLFIVIISFIFFLGCQDFQYTVAKVEINRDSAEITQYYSRYVDYSGDDNSTDISKKTKKLFKNLLNNSLSDDEQKSILSDFYKDGFLMTSGLFSPKCILSKDEIKSLISSSSNIVFNKDNKKYTGKAKIYFGNGFNFDLSLKNTDINGILRSRYIYKVLNNSFVNTVATQSKYIRFLLEKGSTYVINPSPFSYLLVKNMTFFKGSKSIIIDIKEKNKYKIFSTFFNLPKSYYITDLSYIDEHIIGYLPKYNEKSAFGDKINVKIHLMDNIEALKYYKKFILEQLSKKDNNKSVEKELFTALDSIKEQKGKVYNEIIENIQKERKSIEKYIGSIRYWSSKQTKFIISNKYNFYYTQDYMQFDKKIKN